MHAALIIWQARRDSNPQPSDLESDALPLELLACILFCLFMKSMGLTETTIFLEFQLVRCGSFIFCRAVIATFAISTAQMNDFAHIGKPYLRI